MAVADVLIEAESEKAQAQAVYRRAPLALPDDLWCRLDILSSELGWSRNRLLVRLIDEASYELAALMSRDKDGQMDVDRLCELVGDGREQ